MKVKDYPEETAIQNLLLRLPDDVLKDFQEYVGGERDMYFVGSMMGDIFMSPIHPTDATRALYPFPIHIEPKDLLEWEVISIYKE